MPLLIDPAAVPVAGGEKYNFVADSDRRNRDGRWSVMGCIKLPAKLLGSF